MKKTYRITIDYEFEINERVKAPGDGEYSRELLEKTQHIMDAFFRCPEVLHEFIKESFYWGFLDCDPSNHGLGELIGIKDSERLMVSSLVKYLPSETIPYLQGLNCIEKEFPGSNKEEEEARWLLGSQFGPFIPLKASIEDIGDLDSFNLDKKIICRDLGNCKLFQSIIEFLHQEARCA